MLKKRIPAKYHAEIFIEELEARQLFSAGAEAVLPAPSPVADQAVHADIGTTNAQQADAQANSSAINVKSSSPQEVVFIDPTVNNYQGQLNNILAQGGGSKNIEVVVLDSQKDGISQISDTLAGHTNLEAVYVIAQSDNGSLWIGNSQLNFDTLDPNNSEIKAWCESLASEGKFFVNDNNLAINANGHNILKGLASMSCAHACLTSVVASDTDAQPEQTGSIETTVVVGASTQETWGHILTTETSDSPSSDSDNLLAAPDSITTTRHELVFVDTAVEDYQGLLAGISPNAEVIILDPTRDGVQQISELLEGRHNIDAIHILSHGVDGALELGNSWLNSYSLEARAANISQWQNALSSDADILLYGCNVAADAEGKAFVGRLSQLTGADVAASEDATGAAVLGGNWNLEYAAGQIKTGVAIEAQTQQDWAHVMAISVGTTSSSMTTGATSLTFAHTIASGTNGILIVNVSFQAGSTNAITSVTYGGTALTFLGSAQNASGAHTRTEMWFLKTPVTGTANVVISMNASIAFTGGATNFFGVDQTTPTGTFVGTTANNRTPSVTVTSASGELVIDSLAERATSSGTAGASQTEKYHQLTGTAGADTWGSSSTAAGAASVTMSWTTAGSGTGEFALGAVSLKPVLNTTPTGSVTISGAAAQGQMLAPVEN